MENYEFIARVYDVDNSGFVKAFWVEQITATNLAHAQDMARNIVEDRIAFELDDYSGLQHTYDLEVCEVNQF